MKTIVRLFAIILLILVVLVIGIVLFESPDTSTASKPIGVPTFTSTPAPFAAAATPAPCPTCAPSPVCEAAQPAVALPVIVEGVDNIGLPYTVEDAIGLEALQFTTSVDVFGDLSMDGEFVNPASHDVLQRFRTDFIITYYGADGSVVEVNNASIQLSDIQPGQRSPFRASSIAEANQIASYAIQIVGD